MRCLAVAVYGSGQLDNVCCAAELGGGVDAREYAPVGADLVA